MAFWTQDEEPEEVLNEINVVPLIDIMLVLLVLFIVTASAVTTQIHVNLPDADAQSKPDDSKPLVVSVDKQGDYSVNGNQVDLNEMKDRLARLYAAHPKKVVQLQADRDASYGPVAKAMAAIQTSGIKKIQVLTEP